LIHSYVAGLISKLGDRLISVCVFGSVARGEAREGSVDVLVVAEWSREDMGSRLRETEEARRLVRRGEIHPGPTRRVAGTISEIDLTPQEVSRHPPILLDLVDEGVIVFDRNHFLENVLRELRERLRLLGAKRVEAKKGHYWVLKPDLKPGEVVEI